MFWKTCFFALLATPAFAGSLDIQVDNFTVDRGIHHVVMKVTNSTSRTLENTYINCAILDRDKRAIGIAKANIEIMYPGSHRYEDATLVSSQRGQYVECRTAN
jgi:hypothetical protein